MFTWKRLFFSLGFLFLTVIIGWATWYFTIVRPKLIAEPVMRYNTESQTTMENTSDAAVAGKSHIKKDTQEDNTVQTHKHPENVSQSKREGSKNIASSPAQKESDQQAHSSKTHPHNDEEWAKELKEIEEFSEIVRERTAGVKARLKLMEENRAKRMYEKANRLNSLSAEEQQAYFDNMRDGKEVAKILPNFFEALRNNAKTLDIPDEITDTFVENFKQRMQERTSEAGVKRHLEELRAHGFKPKF